MNNVFLDGDLNKEVYMEQPLGFVNGRQPHHVYRLHKALYGLKQSPQAWFTKLSECLLQLGFLASKFDSSMLFFCSASNIVIMFGL